MTDYKCIKDVVMAYSGNIVFTKGKIYTATDDDNGYLFKDDTNSSHFISKMFLAQHFKQIQNGLHFKIL